MPQHLVAVGGDKVEKTLRAQFQRFADASFLQRRVIAFTGRLRPSAHSRQCFVGVQRKRKGQKRSILPLA